MGKPIAASSGATSPLIEAVIGAIEDVLVAAERPVHLHEPRFALRERELVLDCIDTNWVSYNGAYVVKFEQMVAQACGTRHAIAIVNGTVALHAALLLEGVQPNDEVIVPAITFVATANAVSHAGAIPHFVDSTWATLGIDAAALDAHLAEVAAMKGGELRNLKTGRRIKAVVPVHVFGHPVDMAALQEVAAKYGLVVVEDATESLGSSYRGTPCGSLGHSAVMSFNGNKLVTTGAGGMIATNDEAFAKRALHITTTAKLKHPWAFDHDEVGYNYRLPNLNAALGCAQMERLDRMIEAKRALARRYIEAFTSVDGVCVVEEPAGSRSNYWLNTLVLDRPDVAVRDALLAELHARKIYARPLWTPMHHLPMYRDCPRAALPVAEDMFARCVSVPSSPFLMPSA